jgi:hypothetical protein
LDVCFFWPLLNRPDGVISNALGRWRGTDKVLPMIPAILLIVSAVVYRIATALLITSGSGWLSNFAPVAAIVLCSAAYLPTKYKFALPLIALFVSDVVLNRHYGFSIVDLHVLSHYIAFAFIGLIGFALRHRASLKTLLPASIAGSTIFYVFTNAFAWLTDPGYAKTFGGLIQALTVGLPQFSATPSWMFFRNSLLSDLFFTALFVLCMNLGRKPAPAREEAALPRLA